MGAPEQSLPDTYHGWIERAIDEKGVGLNHGLVVHDDGKMTVLALDLTPVQSYAFMLAQWGKPDAASMIFALDRWAKPGQGTTLGDLVAGFYCARKGQRPLPFIIEYQHDPRIVKPIQWSNLFWNAVLHNELQAAMRRVLGLSTPA